MWDVVTNALGSAYKWGTELFGDDLIERGLEYGMDYLEGDDSDYGGSSSTGVKRLRGRVAVSAKGMTTPYVNKAVGSKINSTYDVVYNKYNNIFKSALSEAKRTTRKG